jgi:hypothetical protein
MGKISRVQFVIEEFGEDASEVTRIVGFEPTGVSGSGFTSLSHHLSWWFELPEPVPDEITDHATKLIQFLQSHGEGVRLAANRFRARIAIAIDDRDWVWPYDPTGPRIGQLDLQPNLTAAVAALGLGFAIHVYCGLEIEPERRPAQRV